MIALCIILSFAAGALIASLVAKIWLDAAEAEAADLTGHLLTAIATIQRLKSELVEARIRPLPEDLIQ